MTHLMSRTAERSGSLYLAQDCCRNRIKEEL